MLKHTVKNARYNNKKKFSVFVCICFYHYGTYLINALIMNHIKFITAAYLVPFDAVFTVEKCRNNSLPDDSGLLKCCCALLGK